MREPWLLTQALQRAAFEEKIMELLADKPRLLGVLKTRRSRGKQCNRRETFALAQWRGLASPLDPFLIPSCISLINLNETRFLSHRLISIGYTRLREPPQRDGSPQP